MTEAISTKQLRIAGRVQGVGYRAGFVREAQRLHLSGWVRNRLDGTVEAMVRGNASAVDAIISWCRKGPGLARVDDVRVDAVADETLVSLSREFAILPTE